MSVVTYAPDNTGTTDIVAPGAQERRSAIEAPAAYAIAHMTSLVALHLPGGPRFVEELTAAWDAGDAVLPLDVRLPEQAVRAIVDHVRPATVVTASGDRHELADALPLEEGDALVVATGGSTGELKAAILTHEAVQASATASSRRLGVDPGRDRWLACLPLGHIGGMAVVTRAIVTGATLSVHDGFSAEAAVEDAKAGPTFVSLVPAALRRLDPSVFERVLLGGAAPPDSVPENAVVTYGMTETGSGIVYDGVPLDGVQVVLDDSGEIRVKGPMLLRAYREGDDPHGYDPKSPNGWFHTGDAGWLDEDGRLHVRGRIAEVIVTGGEKVWPAAVERAISHHPGVADVAVAGVPDDAWGERVVAYVVASDGNPPSLGDLKSLVADTIAPWAAPKELVLVDSLPRSPMGKLLKAQLSR